MKKLLAKIYGLYAAAVFFLLTPLMALVFFLISIYPFAEDKPKLIALYRFTNAMLWIWQLFTQVKMRTEGWEKFDKERQYIFVCNHVNMLDIAIWGRFFRYYARPLAKKEIQKIPFFGQLFTMTSIMVDRSSKESRAESMKVMTDALKRGVSIIIFPEGTRNRTDLPTKDFHQGAFKLAIQTQLPVLPIVLINLRHLQPVKTWELYWGDEIILRVLDPIATTGLTDMDAPDLSDKVKQIMEGELFRDDLYWRKWKEKGN